VIAPKRVTIQSEENPPHRVSVGPRSDIPCSNTRPSQPDPTSFRPRSDPLPWWRTDPRGVRNPELPVLAHKRIVSRCNAVGFGVRVLKGDNINRRSRVRPKTRLVRRNAAPSESRSEEPLKGAA
jgi:hypothetical protein